MKTSENKGGGGIIIGTQPVDYWVRSFASRLPAADRDRVLGILWKYDQSGYAVTPQETQFVIACLGKIAASLDGL